jgi:hypothetical protein
LNGRAAFAHEARLLWRTSAILFLENSMREREKKLNESAHALYVTEGELEARRAEFLETSAARRREVRQDD